MPNFINMAIYHAPNPLVLNTLAAVPLPEPTPSPKPAHRVTQTVIDTALRREQPSRFSFRFGFAR